MKYKNNRQQTKDDGRKSNASLAQRIIAAGAITLTTLCAGCMSNYCVQNPNLQDLKYDSSGTLKYRGQKVAYVKIEEPWYLAPFPDTPAQWAGWIIPATGGAVLGSAMHDGGGSSDSGSSTKPTATQPTSTGGGSHPSGGSGSGGSGSGSGGSGSSSSGSGSGASSSGGSGSTGGWVETD